MKNQSFQIVLKIFSLSFLILFFVRKLTSLILFESILLSLVIGTSFILFQSRKIKPRIEQIIPALAGALLFYSLAFSTVMNTDRSKSLYVISWIHDTQPVTPQNLEVILKNRYGYYDQFYVEQRIREQSTRKIVELEKGQYKLTTIGEVIWNAAELLAFVFELNGWDENKIQPVKFQG